MYKNSVPGDTSALSPGGIRIGTPSLTTRGFNEENFEKVAYFLHRCISISQEIQQKNGRKLKDFNKDIEMARKQ